MKKYGILTPEEEAEEAARREKNKREMAERVAKEKAREKEEERRKWWDGAEYMFGPREGSEEWLEEKADKDKKKEAERSRRTEQQQKNLIDRYSSDYNRWNDSSYVPDDPASKLEAEEAEKKKEEEENAKFEARNSEWCNAMKDDMAKVR